jgi:predicted TIM-barrel fold metal-dependent hydrolase
VRSEEHKDAIASGANTLELVDAHQHLIDRPTLSQPTLDPYCPGAALTS